MHTLNMLREMFGTAILLSADSHKASPYGRGGGVCRRRG